MSPNLPGDGIARVRGHVLRRPRREGEPRHQDTRRSARGLQGHVGVSFPNIFRFSSFFCIDSQKRIDSLPTFIAVFVLIHYLLLQIRVHGRDQPEQLRARV